MKNKHKKAFITIFNETAPYMNRYQLYSDFIDCSAAAIHNRLSHDNELEQTYFECVRRYKPEDMLNITRMLAEVVMGLETNPSDFLGEVFMELELGNKHRGQVFTPFHISKLSASLILGDGLSKLDTVPFITCAEPVSGSGSMIIAFAETMRESGYNPQEKLWAQCTDVDSRCARMTFIQMSLMGLAGAVITGNSLTNEVRKVMYTPAHYMNGWNTKLNQSYSQLEEPQHLTSVQEIEQIQLFNLDLAS